MSSTKPTNSFVAVSCTLSPNPSDPIPGPYPWALSLGLIPGPYPLALSLGLILWPNALGFGALGFGFLAHCLFCLDPKDAPHGTLGSCEDSGSLIQRHHGKRECAGHGWQYWIITVAYLIVLFGLYVYNHSIVFSIGFFKKAKKQIENLSKQKDKLIDTSFNPAQMLRLKWLDKHPGIYLLLVLPEAFLFGLHFRTVGARFRYYIYNFFFWTGVIFAILFFAIALPLDKAWRCYPQPTLQSTKFGRCDTQGSIAHQRFHVKTLKHTEFFWITVSIWAIAHSLAVALYLWSTLRFRALYSEHLVRKLFPYMKIAP